MVHVSDAVPRSDGSWALLGIEEMSVYVADFAGDSVRPHPGITRAEVPGALTLMGTGDTIFLRDGEWRTAVLDSSDRNAYRDSLALIRELDFDVLVPWIASGPFYALTGREDTRRRIDALIERI